MARTSYYVVNHSDGWAVKREGADRASGVFSTQEEAIQRARQLALDNQPSQVIVQGRDGKFRTEWTYGDDPFPPPG